MKRKINDYILKYNNMSIQVKASFWFLICGFLQKGVSFITTPIFTRLLTTAEYGQYSVFNSWLGIVSVFISLQLYSGAFTQGMVKFEDKKMKYAASLQGLCLTLVVCWTVIYIVFFEFWNHLFKLTTVQMLAMLVMIWTTSVFNFWAVEQRVDFKYQKLVIITFIATIAKPFVGIIFVFLADDKVTARILGLALVELICYGWMFFSQMFRGRIYYEKNFWRHALLFNLPLIPHYLSMVVLNSADRIMIKNMVGSDEAGIYSLAYSISQIMTVFNSALLQTIEPWMYKKIKIKCLEDMSKVAYPAFICVAAVNLILIAFAPEAIALFAPSAYYDAIWIIPPVAMSVYFTFAYSFFAVFEFYYEKTKYISLATVSGAIFNIVLNYIFIKRFGYYAAGYTTLVCFIIFTVYHFYFMRKICKQEMDGMYPYRTTTLLIITGVFITLGFCLLFTYHNIAIRYCFITLLSIGGVIKHKTILNIVREITNIRQPKE